MNKISRLSIFLIAVILGTISFIGCENTSGSKEIFKGELYFKLIDFNNELYSMKDENGITLSEKLDTIADISLLNKNDKYLKEQYEMLKKHGLLDKSSFKFYSSNTWMSNFMNISEVEYKTVFVEESEYQKVQDYDLSQLEEQNQKVKLKIYGISISKSVIVCDSIISVKQVTGKTKWQK